MTRLGVLTRTFGLNGAIRCALDYEPIPSVTLPSMAWTGYSESFLQPVTLTGCDSRGSELICTFQGITTPDQAAALVDRALFVPTDAVSYPSSLANPGIVGYEVRDENAKELGTIVGLFKTPAHFVWTVRQGDREWMLPAIDEFIIELRHEDRLAIVRPIPGMIEEESDDAG